jgi:hypothetical protein
VDGREGVEHRVAALDQPAHQDDARKARKAEGCQQRRRATPRRANSP